MKQPFFKNRSSTIFKLIRFLYHLPKFAELVIRLFRDKRVPVYRKAILVVFEVLALIFSAIYFVFPLDFDFLPLIGKIDDLLVAIGLILAPGIWLFVKMCPPEVVNEHVKEISAQRWYHKL